MALPTENEVSRALTYLAETDEKYAVLKGAVRAQEYLLKHHKAVAMMKSPEKSVAARETAAMATESYVEQVRDYEMAIVEYETVAAKRERAQLTIDVWRSLNAARRVG